TGAEGHTKNQGAIAEPGVRCFRTRTSRIRADRVFPYRRRRLFALLRRPYTKIDISRPSRQRWMPQPHPRRLISKIRSAGTIHRFLGRLTKKDVSDSLGSSSQFDVPKQLSCRPLASIA